MYPSGLELKLNRSCWGGKSLQQEKRGVSVSGSFNTEIKSHVYTNWQNVNLTA